MSAMEIHNAVGQVIVVGLLIAAGLSVVVFLVVVIRGAINAKYDAALDVINSQYLSADGKSYDWSKGDLPQGMYGAARARINTPAYRNGDTQYDKDKGVIMPPDPEEIEVDADDMPDEESTDAPTIEWDEPNYDELRAQKQARILTPRK